MKEAPALRIPYRIRHWIPGRIRFHLPTFEGNPKRLAALEGYYQTLPGVHAVRAHPRTGTLLIQYDPGILSLARLVYPLYFPTQGLGESRPARTVRKGSPHGTEEGSSLRWQALGVAATGLLLGVLGLRRYLGRWIPWILRLPVQRVAGVAAVLAGIPVFREGLHDMVENRRLSLDFLVSVAAV